MPGGGVYAQQGKERGGAGRSQHDKKGNLNRAFKKRPAGYVGLMSGVGCSGGSHTHHNYQGCRSYETPNEVGVQAKPATAMRDKEGAKWGENVEGNSRTKLHICV